MSDLELEMEADVKAFLSAASYRPLEYISPPKFLETYWQGGFFNELFGQLTLVSTPLREIVPVTGKLPRTVTKMLKKSTFTFSTNQRFSEVMLICAEKKMDGTAEEKWIGRKAQESLVKLRQANGAHSVEIYEGAKLVGGSLFVQNGGIMTGLSVFSHGAGAGNAAIAVPYVALQKQGFDAIDAICPSLISRLFGGWLWGAPAYAAWRHRAANKALEFPTLAGILAVRDFIQPLLPADRDEQNVRTFPRQERDASERQDRGQALENIREARARNCRLGQTGPA
jgi:Leu/Phe-tRNA-protein transferase